jgi:hypothetical protein
LTTQKVDAQTIHFIVESKIGVFNFDSVQIRESLLVSQYGQGYVHQTKIGSETLEKSRTYFVADENVWIETHLSHVLDENLECNVEAILITKKKLCDKRFQPIKSFGPLVTSKGVRIGDSLSKIIEVYGNPSVSIEIGKDKSFSVLVKNLKLKKGRVIRYLSGRSDELLFTEFYFDKNKLHSLLVSGSE